MYVFECMCVVVLTIHLSMVPGIKIMLFTCWAISPAPSQLLLTLQADVRIKSHRLVISPQKVESQTLVKEYL